MLDLIDGQEELEGMLQRTTTELSAVVGEQMFDLDALVVLEGQHGIVEAVHGGQGLLGEGSEYGSSQSTCPLSFWSSFHGVFSAKSC
jgi:hypothetical protein